MAGACWWGAGSMPSKCAHYWRGGDGVVIGLPSLQAMDRAQETRIWLASEAMDMRCGFDRLAERARAVIGEDPLSGHWSCSIRGVVSG